MFILLWLCTACRHLLRLLCALLWSGVPPLRFGQRKARPAQTRSPRHPPKPAWVRREVLRLTALMPDAGCRRIAGTFNRRFASAKQMTVGKTFVNTVIRTHQYDILVLRQKIKRARPRPVPRNLIWGMDLTGKRDGHGRMHPLLGIIEHGSWLSVCLVALRDKSSLTLLRHFIETIRRYGTPKILRTDNEAVFTSIVFRLALWLLGIRHQRTDPHCPWQNGRVERVFGTLKHKLDQWQVEGRDQLNGALGLFQFWYNHVRPHQNLGGRTPAEVWNGASVFTRRPKREYWFEAWDGLLTGWYLPV